MKNSKNPDYISRLNKVFLFIDNNLHKNLTLEELAEKAHFSPFHFHRIFKAITHETLNQYIMRRRMEKCAAELLHYKEKSVFEIAQNYGFNSAEVFSRNFKKYYGESATMFRENHPQKYSKIRQVNRKNNQAYLTQSDYLSHIKELQNWISMNDHINIVEAPELKIAYVTALGVQNIEKSFNELIKWAAPKGLVNENTSKFLLQYHDSFKVTPPDKVRISCSLILDELVKAEGIVGIKTISASKCIVGRFEISKEDFQKAWTSLFLWMNENGYEFAQKDPYEIMHNDPKNHPEHKFIVDMYIPVK